MFLHESVKALVLPWVGFGGLALFIIAMCTIDIVRNKSILLQALWAVALYSGAIGGAGAMFIGMDPSIEDLEQRQRQNELMLKTTWEFASVEQYYTAGTTRCLFHTEVTLQAVNGKWPYEAPTWDFADEGGYNLPKSWRRLILGYQVGKHPHFRLDKNKDPVPVKASQAEPTACPRKGQAFLNPNDQIVLAKLFSAARH